MNGYGIDVFVRGSYSHRSGDLIGQLTAVPPDQVPEFISTTLRDNAGAGCASIDIVGNNGYVTRWTRQRHHVQAAEVRT